MNKGIPEHYKGKKNRSGLAIFICIVLLISSGVFVMWNLSSIVNFFRGSVNQWTQQPENEPPVQTEQTTEIKPEPEQLQEQTPKQSSDQIVGVYLPASQANSAQSILDFAEKAKNLGANGLIIDVKDNAGSILFKTPLGYSFMSAVTKDGAFDLAQTVSRLKEEGFYLTARMSCFYDNSAPRKNPAMAIKTKGVVWLDWDYKSWLNPYNELSKEYLGDLAQYFCSIGFDEVLLSNVEFPVRGKIELVDYGVPDTIANKQTALIDFLAYMKERISGSGSVALQVSTTRLTEEAQAQTGIDLKRLISQADVFVPQIYPAFLPNNSKVGNALISNPQNEAGLTVNALCTVIEELSQNGAQKTEIRPMIQGFAALTNGEMTGVCSDTVIQAQLKALENNLIAQYEVYQPEGMYGQIRSVKN